MWNSPFFSFFGAWGETSNYKEFFGGAPSLSLSHPISSALQQSIIVVSEAALSGVYVMRQPSLSSLPTFLTFNSNLLGAISEEESIRGPQIGHRFWRPYWCLKWVTHGTNSHSEIDGWLFCKVILLSTNILWKVQLDWRRKLALLGICSLTIFVIAVAITRVIVVNTRMDITLILLWGAVELSVGKKSLRWFPIWSFEEYGC